MASDREGPSMMVLVFFEPLCGIPIFGENLPRDYVVKCINSPYDTDVARLCAGEAARASVGVPGIARHLIHDQPRSEEYSEGMNSLLGVPRLECPFCRLVGFEAMVTPVPLEPLAPHGPKVDRKDRIQAGMMHCQNCDYSRADGAKLFRCSACKTELYCSQKCQREAWPTHKSKCTMNQLIDALRPDSVDVMKQLRTFSSKHGPSLADGGYAAMNIFEHPERATDSVFAVAMRPRRNSTRPETGFYVYDARVFRLADLPYPVEERDRINEMIVTAGQAQKKHGAAGVFLVMMHNVEGCMTNAVPFTYYERAENHQSKEMQENWKPYMLRMLNEGIVQ